MEFWQVKVKYINANQFNEDFNEIIEDERFYEDIEQAMAAVLYMQNDDGLEIIDISIKKRSTGICRIEYTLNKKGE